MNIEHEIQTARRQIDMILNQLLRKVTEYEQSASQGRPRAGVMGDYESIYPLVAGGSAFKGEKPTGLLFGEERVDVYTWKMVFQEILKRCNEDPEKHVALMNLRGKVSGRARVFLAKNSASMRSPHEIAKNLYVETHYDTETLLRILMTRILDAVNYDYSGISVAVRNRP